MKNWRRKFLHFVCTKDKFFGFIQFFIPRTRQYRAKNPFWCRWHALRSKRMSLRDKMQLIFHDVRINMDQIIHSNGESFKIWSRRCRLWGSNTSDGIWKVQYHRTADCSALLHEQCVWYHNNVDNPSECWVRSQSQFAGQGNAQRDYLYGWVVSRAQIYGPPVMTIIDVMIMLLFNLLTLCLFFLGTD